VHLLVRPSEIEPFVVSKSVCAHHYTHTQNHKIKIHTRSLLKSVAREMTFRMNEDSAEARMAETAVECEALDLANKKSVLLKTKKDLLKLAKMLNRPILHWQRKWIVIEDDMYFQFEDENQPSQSET